MSKASLTSPDLCNFYGVIVDATFPYKVRADRFICSLKVIDPTLNPKTKSHDFAQVVIYAKRFEDLPIIHRLGDVIRIHRANLRMYNNARQFNVNVYFKSAWALYSSDKTTPLGQPATDGPYGYSGKKYTNEKQDAHIISTLKRWSLGFFQQN